MIRIGHLPLTLLLILVGCGGAQVALDPAPTATQSATSTTSQPQPLSVQILRKSDACTDDQVSAQAVAINTQLQGSFLADWHISARAFVATIPTPGSYVVHLVDLLPDPAKQGKVFGYWANHEAWVDVPACLADKMPTQWQVTCDHEILEMLAGVSICDPVARNAYGPNFGDWPVLSDYVLPSWRDNGAWPYDHLHYVQSPGEFYNGNGE